MKNRFREVCDSRTFVNELVLFADWFSGVPDSDLSATIALVPNWNYVPRENHAIGLAFGASLGGKSPAVLLQNSGLGLCLDALSGTFMLFGRPLLLIVSNRGVLSAEEPQHHHWGRVTKDLLSSFEVPMCSLDEFGLKAVEMASQVARETEGPAAVLVERGNLVP